MKNLKFRAWNKEEKKWIEQGFNGIGLTLSGIASWLDGGEMVCDVDEYVEIMQYTGCNDITGKEIYEGDIVKIDYGDELLIGIMEFYDFAWCIKSKYKNGKNLYYPIFCEDVDLIEILGNIYENPELLEYK